MSKCIYVITQSIFSERDKERFGVNYFLSMGYKVVVLDLTLYLYPELSVTHESYKNESNFSVFRCENFKSIKKTLRSNGSGIAFLFVHDTYKIIRVKKLLCANRVRYGRVESGFLPSPSLSKLSIKDRVVSGIKRRGLLGFIGILFDRIYTRYNFTQSNDFLITSNKSKSNYSKDIPLIEINSFDYDEYLASKNKKNLSDRPCVVYIDQNLFDCKDYIRTNVDLKLDRTKFFSELNVFFKMIESIFDCEIVIAAHPKCDIDKAKGDYFGRKVCINKTALLIRDSLFVINYYSTAISFAVLNRKPIIFLSNDDIDKTEIHQCIDMFAQAFHRPIINMSKKISRDDLMIDEVQYSDYESMYVKSFDTDLTTWEIVFSKFKALGFL